MIGKSSNEKCGLRSGDKVHWDRITTEHLVHFFASPDELAATAAGYFSAGLAEGGVALCVATDDHRSRVERDLAAGGIDLSALRKSGRYASFDAGETLSKLVQGENLNYSLFQKVIGSIVSKACRTGKKVRVFGEMVSLLWQVGNRRGAVELERFWNELATREKFSLFCAYPKRTEDVNERELADVCNAHSVVLL